MLHELNSRGHRHIPRVKYEARNRPTCNEALRNRDSLTIWISPQALAAPRPPGRTTRDGETIYSDLAVEMRPSLRVAFDLALRQIEGLLISVLQLLKVDLAVPDRAMPTAFVPDRMAGASPKSRSRANAATAWPDLDTLAPFVPHDRPGGSGRIYPQSVPCNIAPVHMIGRFSDTLNADKACT